jgi:hypothetical protein
MSSTAHLAGRIDGDSAQGPTKVEKCPDGPGPRQCSDVEPRTTVSRPHQLSSISGPSMMKFSAEEVCRSTCWSPASRTGLEVSFEKPNNSGEAISLVAATNLAPREAIDTFLQSDLCVVMVCVGSSAFLNRSSSIGCRASKEDEILIWVRDYKGSGTPRLLLKCLMEGDSCSLIAQK